MKNKKVPIVINLVKLSKNQYAVAEPDVPESNNSKASNSQTTSNIASSSLGASAATATAAIINPNNNVNNNSSSKKQFPKQPSIQNNSQINQLKSQDQQANTAAPANNNTNNNPNMTSIQQASLSSLSHQTSQQLAPGNVLPPKAVQNASQPSMIIRGQENTKDIFPYSDRQPSQQQQQYIPQLQHHYPQQQQPQQSQQQLSQQQPQLQQQALQQQQQQQPDQQPHKKYQVVIPQCSHWFDLERIHQIEKESLPEFFQGKPSKTPEIYKKYRNFIVQLYRSNPRVHLTATACRRNLAGDVCSILRLHAFLEDWGIINFNCDPKLTPQSLLLFKPSNSSQPLYKYNQHSRNMDLKHEQSIGEDSDLIMNSVKLLSKNHRPACDFCGITCGLAWYQSRVSLDSQMPNLALCIKCYAEENYPAVLSEKDFDRTDLIQKLSTGANTAKKQPWTHEETLNLLEKIEKHRDNWDLIEKELASSNKRTREEIILHFLRLPLQSVSQVRVFDTEDETAGLDRQPYEQAAEDQPTIFSDFSNPLMQHIAIFKSLLDRSKQKHKKIKAVPKNVVQQIDSQVQSVQKVKEEMTVVKKETQNVVTAAVESPDQMEKEVEGSSNAVVVEAVPITVTEAVVVENTTMEVEEEKPEQAKSIPVKVEELQQQQSQQQQLESSNAHLRLGLIDDITESDEQDLLAIERETKRRSHILQEHEGLKIKKLVQGLIYCQMQKLESKLNYLEEYEKLIWYERNQLDVTQTYNVAETVSLTYRKNEFTKEFSRQYAEQHKKVQAAAAAAALHQQQLQQQGVAGQVQPQQQQQVQQFMQQNQQNGQFNAPQLQQNQPIQPELVYEQQQQQQQQQSTLEQHSHEFVSQAAESIVDAAPVEYETSTLPQIQQSLSQEQQQLLPHN